MRRTKRKMIVRLMLIILIFSIIGIIWYINSKSKTTTVSKNFIETDFVTLGKNNTVISIKEDEATIQRYNGNAETVVIDKDTVDTNKININYTAFAECNNLETILIDKSMVSEELKIEDFEVDQEYENEQYIKLKTTKQYSEAYSKYIAMTEEEKRKVQAIPNKYDVSMSALYTESMEENYNVSSIAQSEIPESFDLRDYIDIEVENQGSTGICFAFASLEAVETNIAINKQEKVDLSEVHLASLAENSIGYGGTFIPDSDSYYANEIGPVYESEWPISDLWATNKDTTTKAIYNYLTGASSSLGSTAKNALKATTAKKNVTETVNFPTISKGTNTSTQIMQNVDKELVRKTIKKHIMEYGSLYCTISSGAIFSYNGNYVLNANQYSSIDHAVSIIGWDDNYSRENFRPGYQPANNGAYLALNSWGDSWGESGYFWISYEDYWAETNLSGVISVEGNFNLDSIELTNVGTLEKIESNIITKGINVEAKINVNIGELVDNKNELTISVISPNGEDITEQITISGNSIKNNKAQVIFGINTTELEIGEYTINLKYDDETISTTIQIVEESVIEGDGWYYVVKESKLYILENNEEKSYEYLSDNIFAVEFADSVESLLKSQFATYPNLEEVILPNNLKSLNTGAFQDCKKLQKIVLPEGITEIGENTFSGCSNLQTIDMKADIVSVGRFAFYLCTSLENINIPVGVSNIGEAAFIGTKIQNINIASGVILDNAFEICTNLKSVNMLEGVTSIGYGAFYKCEALENVNMPETLKEIGDYAFNYAGSIQNLCIPNSVTSIGYGTFAYSKVQNVDIESGLIGGYSFYGCEQIENVNIGEGVTAIGEAAFAYSNMKNVEIQSKGTIGEAAFIECEALTNVIIGSGITKIENEAFYKCTALESVEIENGLVEIGFAAFMYCTNLQNIDLPEGLITIGGQAFAYCENIINLSIPNTVTTLDDLAFAYAKTYVIINTGTTEIDKLPKIIQRTMGTNDILTCNKNFTISNASFNSDYSKLIVNENAETIEIYINNGGLLGLTIIAQIQELDNQVPTVEFETNGNINWAQTHSTKVTLTDTESGLKKSTLKYIWTKTNTQPTEEKFDTEYKTATYKGIFSNGETLSINTENMSWYLWISAEDMQGNRLVSSTKEFYLDNTAPVIEEVTGNPTDWTKEDVTLTIKSTDAESGLNIEPYSFDNGATWQAENTKTFSKNTNEIIVKVRDISGNVSTNSKIDITKIRRPESIEVTTPPEKTEYNSHEQFDSTGMIITIIYDNGNKEETTNYTILNGQDLTCKVDKVQIQYNENTELKNEIDVTIAHEEVIEKGQEATCTKPGITEGKKCSVCNTIIAGQEEIKALGHNFTNYNSDNNADCTKDGTKTAKCDRCETTQTITEEGSKLDHTEAILERKEATCKETGLTEGKYCSVCNTVLVEQQEIPTIEHTYEDTVTQPTCTKQGYTTHKCVVCEEEYVDSYVDELGHSFTNYISDNNATCTEDGSLTAKCDRCEETYTITDKGSKKTHIYENGKCTLCGEDEPKPEITSEKYHVQDTHISKVQAKTTVKDFKAQIQTNSAEINIYNANNEKQEETSTLGTGMRVELKLGNQTKSFTIVVQGDVTGDGKVEFMDLLKINQHILNKKLLTNEELLAAEVTGDDKVSFMDLIKINSFRLNKLVEL